MFRRHIPKQVELDKFIDALKEKVIHDYNIPIHVKAEYKRSPYFRDIVRYIRTGYCSYVGKAQRLFKMLCEEYILMDEHSVQRYVKEQTGKPALVLCVPEKYMPIILCQYHTQLLAGHPWCQDNVPHGKEELLLSYNVTFDPAVYSKLS